MLRLRLAPVRLPLVLPLVLPLLRLSPGYLSPVAALRLRVYRGACVAAALHCVAIRCACVLCCCTSCVIYAALWGLCAPSALRGISVVYRCVSVALRCSAGPLWAGKGYQQLRAGDLRQGPGALTGFDRFCCPRSGRLRHKKSRQLCLLPAPGSAIRSLLGWFRYAAPVIRQASRQGIMVQLVLCRVCCPL